ncbi:MAG TPA: YbhB/YbcL family Raf kinase inhibitor-like protein [Vicinamibacterales bacterium]|nr:YbhB/YbcL family Raf kinase inhibitor-like protein [Vicinamibacterales bacterium]
MRLVNAIYAAVILSVAAAASAQTPATMTVTSPTLKANEVVPIDHTADGKNVSPALSWTGAPANTKQFALVYDDPDVVFGGQTFVHWVVYKIPGTAKGLPAELPMDAVLTAPADIAGTIQGLSGFKRTGYRGPAPPPGKPHHYTWTVYALDAELPLEQGLNRNQLMDAMKGHIIGQGSLVAIYERKPKQ